MTLVAEHWRPALEAPADRVDAFRDAVSATHLPWSLAPPEAAPSHRDDGLDRYRFGDLALVDCRCGPCGGHRGRAQLAATDEPVVGVLFVRAGEEHVEVAGERLVLRPGAALLWRSDEPVRFRVPGRLHKWTLLVPEARLGSARPTGGRLLDPAAVGLLTALLGTTMRSAAALGGRLGMPIADAAVDLLAGALHGPGPDERSDDATWLRVTAHVQRHLRDPDLTPEAMAAAGLVSLRSLYALFAARGETPARYVRRRRLDAAHRELVRRGTSVSVARVAHAWGFGDQATFSRAFRAAYGRTPDDVRRSPPDARGQPPRRASAQP